MRASETENAASPGVDALERFGSEAHGLYKDKLTALAMRATGPTTRPAHSFLKLRAHSLDVLPSGFRLLDGENPADPFIAREWRNILPCRSRRWVRSKDLSQISWHFVYHTSGEMPSGRQVLFFGHTFILLNLVLKCPIALPD